MVSSVTKLIMFTVYTFPLRSLSLSHFLKKLMLPQLSTTLLALSC